MKFSLIVPLWNEGKNVAELIRTIAESVLRKNGLDELILVNNGSSDDTGALIDQGAREFSWIVPIHLNENLNYGGGIYEGFRHARCEYLCFIPGDLQVLPGDVVAVANAFVASRAEKSKLVVKGNRTVRHDPLSTQIVSRVYTFLANRLLALDLNDLNGLPKLFHRSLIDLVPSERMKTFVFDTQILSLARTNGWIIEEIPVTFHSRREGVSSWSGKRLRTYLQIFRQLMRLRTLRHMPGLALERLP